jgi:predicted ester cyclase
MAAAAAYFAEDTRNHGRPVGRMGLLAVLNDIQTTFPDVRFKVMDIVAEGEWVVVRGIVSGTHQGIGRLPVNGGMLVGVPPTRRHFEVQHIHMLQVHEGKIVEHFANRDDLGSRMRTPCCYCCTACCAVARLCCAASMGATICRSPNLN